ncbi:MAG: ATP synthase F1 subunit gamma [Opitutales bacterium]|nr:ATP synthase F1 subunit gamma [Opitutales bacterium]
MANTRDIRNRIKGVKNTAKITRAMQLVASSKMKRAQERAMERRDYSWLMSRMIAAIEEQLPEGLHHPFLDEREVITRCVLVFSTDRGLCGPLNANLFREIARFDRATTAFVTVGRKARQFVSRTNRKLLADFPVSEEARFNEIRPIAEFLIAGFNRGDFDALDVLYPRFKNTLVQVPTTVQMLPMRDFRARLDEFKDDSAIEPLQDLRTFLFEPEAEAILDQLLDLFIKQQIYRIALDARASEHSARMVAMKAATDNAKKLTDQLTLQYNKARQAAITQEILEITAATLHS